MYAERRPKNAAEASNSSLSLSLFTHILGEASPRTRHAAKTNQMKSYLGGADTAVLILLESRGSGLGSLDELKLALTARHTRGLGHLDDVLLPKPIGGRRTVKRKKGWCVGDRSANKGGQETWTSVLLLAPPKAVEQKRGQKKRDLHSNWCHFQLGSAITNARPFVSLLSVSKGGERKKKPVV